MSRKRIVIDLDAPAPAGSPPARAQVRRVKKSRRWTKVLGVLLALGLIVAGILAIGGFVLWKYYQTTPAYALAAMIDAAQRGDAVEFQKRLNEAEIARNMAATVTEKASARYGLALSNALKQQIDSTMPVLMQEIKPAIRDEVTKEIQAFASKSEPKPFILLALGVRSMMTITTEGDSATASGSLNDRRFQIAMQNGEGGWKVTDFKDDVVVQRVVDRVMTRLPAIGELDAKVPTLRPSRRSSRRR
jgi:hypothetical protein